MTPAAVTPVITGERRPLPPQSQFPLAYSAGCDRDRAGGDRNAVVVTMLTQAVDDSLLQVLIVLPLIDRTRVVTEAGMFEPVSVNVC